MMLLAALAVPIALAVPAAAQDGTTVAPPTSPVTVASTQATQSTTATTAVGGVTTPSTAVTRTTVKRRVVKRTTTTLSPTTLTTVAPTSAAVVPTTAVTTTVASASSVAPTVATTTAPASSTEDPAQHTLRLVIYGLIALAAVILIVTVVFWRMTRPPFVDDEGHVLPDPHDDPEGGTWAVGEVADGDPAGAAGSHDTVVIPTVGAASAGPTTSMTSSGVSGADEQQLASALASTPTTIKRPVSTVDPWAPGVAVQPAVGSPSGAQHSGVTPLGASDPRAATSPAGDQRRAGPTDPSLDASRTVIDTAMDQGAVLDPAGWSPDGQPSRRRRPPVPRGSRGTTPRQSLQPPVPPPPPAAARERPPSTSTGFRALGPIPSTPSESDGDPEA